MSKSKSCNVLETVLSHLKPIKARIFLGLFSKTPYYPISALFKQYSVSLEELSAEVAPRKFDVFKAKR